MNYEEVQEILNSKKTIGYPKLSNIMKNPKYANTLYDSFGGEWGELTAITQYIYQHMELENYESLSKILLAIAKEEMMHLDMIGKLIRRLGGRPHFMDSNKKTWHADNVKYTFSSLYELLSHNIKSEQEAIKGYEEAIKGTQNKSIKELLERIIVDEKTHLEIFNRLK